MNVALVFTTMLAFAIPVFGQEESSPLGNLSDRARVVTLTMIYVARQRGADAVDVNDLLVALIIEDQDPAAPELFMNPSPRLLYRTPQSVNNRPAFLPPRVAVDILVKLNQILPPSKPVSTGLPMSPALVRVLGVAQKLPSELDQSPVLVRSTTATRPRGMYQAVVPLDLLAAALQEPCEVTKMLQEAGIREEKVLQILRSGGDLENGSFHLESSTARQSGSAGEKIP
jgi:hypothetical protein